MKSLHSTRCDKCRKDQLEKASMHSLISRSKITISERGNELVHWQCYNCGNKQFTIMNGITFINETFKAYRNATRP